MCDSRCTCRGSGPSRSARGFSLRRLLCDQLWSLGGLGFLGGRLDGRRDGRLHDWVHRIGMVEPVDLVELAQDHELVAVGADRAIVVEGVGEMRVAADN